MALDLIWLLMPPDGEHDATPRAGERRNGGGRHSEPSFSELSLSERDIACVTAIRAGDQIAFEALYRSRYPELFRAAVRLGHTRDGADEIIQDVFLSLWIRRSVWNVRSSVRAYLHGAVRFRAASIARHDTARRAVETVDSADLPESVESSDDPDKMLETTAMHAELLAAISALPVRQRDALILWSRHQMTLTELGESLGVSHVAARKLLRKAQEKLQVIVDRWTIEGNR